MNQGSTYTLAMLLDQIDIIEIPIIQRDYVQGRLSDTTNQVRQQFVQALFDQLSIAPDQVNQPLDLDFIYGGIHSGVFCPLDGQQRLTTLFLLHWYLANADREFEAFKSMMYRNEKSRFSYQTRKTSRMFFNELTRTPIALDTLPTEDRAVSNALRNQKWFFVTFGYDPTVQSVLNVLDTIHSTYSKLTNPSGLYARLLGQPTPYITFQFLDLNDFGLSDDLYIKMNGRGKPLTVFENFKAKFEQTVAKLCPTESHQTGTLLRSYISHKMDGVWTDLFWTFSAGDTQKMDVQQVQFFKHAISALYPLSTTATTVEQMKLVLEKLRENNFQPTHYDYEKLGCFTDTLIVKLVKLLDQLCSDQGQLKTYLQDNPYYDERGQFELAIGLSDQSKGFTYQAAVQFFAWCLFLVEHSEIEQNELFTWTRIVHNLAQNTRFREAGVYTTALLSLRNLINNSADLLQYFAGLQDYLSLQGFERGQVREERIKAQLILRSDDWKKLIYRAEGHPYFKGQIEFLLDFSGILDYFIEGQKCDWDSNEDHQFRQSFETYLLKAEALFQRDGIIPLRDCLFERALLTKGEYLLPRNSNLSFLKNSFDRDFSWKRLLRGSDVDTNQTGTTTQKRKYIKALMDDLQLSDLSQIEIALQRMIENTTPVTAWYAPLIQYPEMIKYCKDSFIRYEDYYKHTLLLKRSQTNGSHRELRSYDLYLSDFKDRKVEHLSPFSKVEAVETLSVDTIPALQFLELTTKNPEIKKLKVYLAVEFFCNKDLNPEAQFWAKLLCGTGQLPDTLTQGLFAYPEYKDSLINPKIGIQLNRANPTPEIDQLLSRLAQIIAQLDCAADGAEASHE